MKIRQPVINTFKRVGIDYKALQDKEYEVETFNRFTSESVTTTPLVAECVSWVYKTSNDYEMGTSKVKISDFDRVRYWILEQDNENGTKVYMTCID